MPPTATDRIVTEVATVGEQTRQVAQRYEGIFAALRDALTADLGKAATAADGARAVMATADAVAQALAAHFPNQPKRDCRAGCDACCHLYVMVPPGIAEAIAEHLTARLDEKAMAALKAELVKAAAAAGALADPSMLRYPCPLLAPDGTCTIYEVRPLTCRSFTSASASACRSLVFDRNSPVPAIPQNPSHFRVYVEATKALEQAALARGRPAEQQGLAAALLAALGEADED